MLLWHMITVDWALAFDAFLVGHHAQNDADDVDDTVPSRDEHIADSSRVEIRHSRPVVTCLACLACAKWERRKVGLKVARAPAGLAPQSWHSRSPILILSHCT